MNKSRLVFIAFNILALSFLAESKPDLDTELLDYSCRTDDDCHQYKRANLNVTCLDLQCVCTKSDDGISVKCKPNPEVANVNNVIRGKCPCNQENSECDKNQNICLCKKGYRATMDSRRCIKRDVMLGGKCEDNSQCIRHEKFSFCDMFKKECSCQENFIEFSGSCLGVVALNDSCISDEQCNNKTANTNCYQGKCACQKGFVSSSARDICLLNAGYNETCREVDQCKNKLGVGSVCYSGKCTCDQWHRLIVENNNIDEFSGTDYCEKIVEYGEYCREHSDCYLYHLNGEEQSMECYRGECKCRKYFIVKDKQCIKSGNGKAEVGSIMVILSILSFLYTYIH